MTQATAKLLRVVTQGLVGLGLFCFLYPGLYKLLAPSRPLAKHHILFLIFGFFFLVDALLVHRLVQSRDRQP